MDKNKIPFQGQDKPMGFKLTKYEQLNDTISDPTSELTWQILV